MSVILSFDEIGRGLKDKKLSKVSKECKVCNPVLLRLARQTDEDFRLYSLIRVSKYIIKNLPCAPDEAFKKKMIDLDELINRIGVTLKGKDIKAISRAAALSYPVLMRIIRKSDNNFRLSTLKRIDAYIKKHNLQPEPEPEDE